MREQSEVRVGDDVPQNDEQQQEEERRRRPWWRRWRPELKVEGGPESIGLAGVGVTGLVLAAVGAALWWFVIHDPKVSLPNLTGLSQASAEARLKEDDLIVRQQLTETSPLAPGSVVRTDPTAGAKLAKGDGVVLYLAVPANVLPSPSQPASTRALPGIPGTSRPQPVSTGGNQPLPSDAQPTATPRTTPAPQPRPTGRPVHVERDLVLGRYNWIDLDNGAYSPEHGGDLYFGQDANSQAFHLQPMSSGGADEVGTAARGYDTCATASTTPDQIALDHLPAGTVVCVRTDEGRLSAVEITGTDDGPNGRNLHIRYTTWEL